MNYSFYIYRELCDIYIQLHVVMRDIVFFI